MAEPGHRRTARFRRAPDLVSPSHTAQVSAETRMADRIPRAAPYLAVVCRERSDVFEYLQHHFVEEGDVVEVIWDRRRGERRAATRDVSADRRQGDRRRQPPFTWTTLGMLVTRGASGSLPLH